MINRIIVGISGASGVELSVKVLELLQAKKEWETHVVITNAAIQTMKLEENADIQQISKLCNFIHDNSDITAPIASGSFPTAGMLIVPCSMKTVAGITSGYSENLLLRAADVTIKERRRLVIAPRECPLSPIHLKNLCYLADIGIEICPPVVNCYTQPKTVDDMLQQIAARLLLRFGIDSDVMKKWRC